MNFRYSLSGFALTSIVKFFNSINTIPKLIQCPHHDSSSADPTCTMSFLESAENVVFLEPPEVGKTHLATILGMEAAKHRFSTYYINCHTLIEQLKKAHYENRLPDRLKVLAKYKLLIIDEIGYLPMDIQGANLFFQLITRRYEKVSTIFTSNKTFSQWSEILADARCLAVNHRDLLF